MRLTRRAGASLLALAAAVALLAGCTPAPVPPGPDDWTLEPIAIDTRVEWRPGAPASDAPREGAGDLVDVSFSMSQLAADGTGGFWAKSAGSFLHVGADGETLARFHDEQLSQVIAIASSTPDELVVARAGTAPAIAVLDTTTMTMRDVPGTAAGGGGSSLFQFVDVATRDGDAIVAHVRPERVGYLTLEILRIDLEDGQREVLHTEPIALDEAPKSFPDVPPVRLDIDAEGAIHLAVPTARVVLNPDGTERTRTPQTANFPQVAVRPDGTALWWGGDAARTSATSAIVGGSADAREAIESRSSCSGLTRSDALRASVDGTEHPLPFLCGANDAIWTGSTWIVAAGGEADGVLVRVTPPKSFG
ncbi:hypothetical protein [Microbacterium sp.]|uniref:hypothetical protein n=1 Tax=Microbacterium sp. TaxID=51671 RepID=UPI003A912E8A